MELTQKKSKQFLERYMDRYANEWESSIECSTRIIEEWIVADEEVEEKAWRDFFRTMLWEKADDIYKMRWDRPETVLEKVMSSMYLNYWPKCLKPV